jgi:hypothetical protein
MITTPTAVHKQQKGQKFLTSHQNGREVIRESSNLAMHVECRCTSSLLLPAASAHAVVIACPTAASSPVRSPAPAAPSLTTLGFTAYATASTAAALAAAALLRNFATMVFIGCCDLGGYGGRIGTRGYALCAGGRGERALGYMLEVANDVRRHSAGSDTLSVVSSGGCALREGKP